jgi:hypothetical protein
MQMLATVQASEAPALLVHSRGRESALVMNHRVWLLYRRVMSHRPTNRYPAQLRLQRDGNPRPLFPGPYEGMVRR